MSQLNEELSAMNAALKALNRISEPDARVAALTWRYSRVITDTNAIRAIVAQRREVAP